MSEAAMESFRSGFMAIIGRPNVGKSTLMNAILGTKVAIVTPRPQTTRNKIAGIATFEDCQVVFLDTPGIHKPRGGGLNRLMVDLAYSSLLDADAVCLVVDAFDLAKRREIDGANRAILERLRETAKPTLLVLNKIDLVKKGALLPLIERFSAQLEFTALIPISALNGDGVETVLLETVKLMPHGDKYYADGQLTDRSRNFIITEFIREKAFIHTRQELPYSVAVSIDLVEERKGDKPLLHIVATIHVERKSQKGMLIGKQGRMVKQIGQEAREDIEKYLGTRVHLELHIRVEKEWSRSLKGIRKVGFET